MGLSFVHKEVAHFNIANSDVDNVIATLDAHLSVGSKPIHREKPQ
jgi:hypothetical protein